MDTINELVSSRYKKDYDKNLIMNLRKIHKGELEVFEGRDGNQELSKENAYLALLLLCDDLTLKEKDEDSWRRQQVTQGSKRYNAIKEIIGTEEFWNEDRFPLLVAIFGQRMAVFVKKAWDMVPNMMYQLGYYRRSFRSSDLKEIYLTRQLGLVNSLIYENNYDFTLDEYVIYSNNIPCNHFSYVFAAAIEMGDSSVKNILLDTVYCRHEISKPSRLVIKSMLLTEDKESWEAVEQLLLTAQREEGLRQTILECLDETSLESMKYFIKVILKNKLTRFSSVVRAIDVWAGLNWEGEKERTVKRFLECVDLYLSEPEKMEEGIMSKDNAEVYMALWAQGVIDVTKCMPMIDSIILKNKGKISLCLYFISQVRLSRYSLKYGNMFLDSKDPLVLCQAIKLIDDNTFLRNMTRGEQEALFLKVENVLQFLPEKLKESKPHVFSWINIQIGKSIAYRLMMHLLDYKRDEDLLKISKYYDLLTIELREDIVYKIFPGNRYSRETEVLKETLSSVKRDFAFSILKDRSESIKTTGINVLKQASLSSEEIQVFESYLTRKSADFRKACLDLITKRGASTVKESATRLLQSNNQDQRLAGLDMLLWLKNNSTEDLAWLSEKAVDFNTRLKISTKETVILKGLLPKDKDAVEYTAENGYMVYDTSKTVDEIGLNEKISELYLQAVGQKQFCFSMPIAKILTALLDLKNLLAANKDYEYTCESWDNSETTVLLGNDFSKIKRKTKDMNKEEIFCNYPLAEVWREWYNNAGLTSLDLYLISLFGNITANGYCKDIFKEYNARLLNFIFIPIIPKVTKESWRNPVSEILVNLCNRYEYENKIDFLSGMCTHFFHLVDDDLIYANFVHKDKWSNTNCTWREQNILSVIWNNYSNCTNSMSEEQFSIYWNLAFWRYLSSRDDENTTNRDCYKPSVYEYTRAYHNNLIDKNTLYWRMFSRDGMAQLTSYVTGKNYDIKKEFPFLNEVADVVRDRVLEIELIRGDSSTSVTNLAQNIRRLWGIENYVDVLKALGKDNLHRGYISCWGSREYNKKEIFSSLLRNVYPSKECTQELFNKAIKEAKITDGRLCDTSIYSPQWLPYVSEYLGWKDMESAVWWLHAHTNGDHNAQTETEIAKYSSIDVSEFADGAVDIVWFKEVYKSLGKAKWQILFESAKYICSGGGHKRALLYADVILGKTKIKEVTSRINGTRNQDYLRVYGLVPLSKTNGKKDLLKRYQFLQKFRKESKQFGSQRQASEACAVKIAMENLARTAGFPDPIRLQWAMESKEAQEIIENAEKLKFDKHEVALEIDEAGKSAIIFYKEGVKCASLPAKYRKEKEYLKLKEFNKTLREQYRRTRASLEAAMVNGDAFEYEEIETLTQHPVVAPMLNKLVLISGEHIGFWKDGKIVSLVGDVFDVSENIRIAHCVDLFDKGEWSTFQKYCFRNEISQPFKQIYRELYVPTADELAEKSISRRYAGHQVQVRKTLALLKGQAWTVDYEDGLQKVNHKQNIISRMYAMADWFSPADVEAPTLETVEFFDRNTGKNLQFVDVDKRVFSETMRDIDLVVSVAHVGEIDPEASQSSIELRSVIVEETCRLFKLDNVSLTEKHVKIKGSLGEYSVHLGSGVCHKVASSSLSIIPVHSQHRGRMFLPFVDEDPKTAEIISKVLLLAKDKEIRDPSILCQI
ncbi:MAG: DUF4132 domain-containing protein [Marinifilaceae bacterium]